MYLFLSLASLAGALYLIYTMISEPDEEVANAELAVAGPTPRRVLHKANDSMIRLGRQVRSWARSLFLRAHGSRRRLQKLASQFRAIVRLWQWGQRPKGDVLPTDGQ